MTVAHGWAGASPLIVNPSFEVDGDFPAGNGRINANGPITGWTASRDDRVGINTTSQPFADNGAVPDGTHVSMIQHGSADGSAPATLTQTVGGFMPGHSYVVTYRENARNSGGDPDAEVALGGTTIVPSHTVAPVGGTNAYHTTDSGIFTASAASHDLVFAALPSTADTTLLIDQVKIRPAYLMFSDNFNVQSSSYNINPGANDLPGRQGGLFAGLSYNDGGSNNNLVQVNNPTYPGSTLFLANAQNSPANPLPYTQTRTHVSPNHNFVDYGGGDFTIEFDMDPANPTLSGQDSDVDPADWAAIVFGDSTQVGEVDTTDGVGFLIRKNNDWVVFDGTGPAAISRVEALGNLGSLGIDDQGFYHVRADYSVPGFDGTSAVDVAIYVDDILVHSFTTDVGFSNNYLVLDSRGDYGTAPKGLTSHGFDNLEVYASSVPEPSALMLLALGLIGVPVLGRRRRR